MVKKRSKRNKRDLVDESVEFTSGQKLDSEEVKVATKKPLKTYTIGGETVTEDDLKHVIKISEAKGDFFNLPRFLLIAFYHFLFFFCTPFVAIPVIFVLEGFDFHLIYNMRFVGCYSPFFV